MAAVLFSCVQQKQEKPSASEKAVIKKDKPGTIEVRLIGTLETRRSYANIQFMKNEKEIDRYLAKQKKSDPELMVMMPGYSDSFLYKAFEQQHLVNGIEFRINRFKRQTKDTASFTDTYGSKVVFKFYNKNGYGHFRVFRGNDSLEINTNATSLQDLDYAFIDIIPGGNKELVFLDDYYVMNGDNFDFKVYEIKTW